MSSNVPAACQYVKKIKLIPKYQHTSGRSLVINGYEMGSEELGYSEGPEAPLDKDLDHLDRIDVPLVPWVLQVVQLEQIEKLDPGGLWDTHNAQEFRRQPPLCAQASVLFGRRHFLLVHHGGDWKITLAIFSPRKEFSQHFQCNGWPCQICPP